MGSVDDIWRQLNVRKGPKTKLSGLTDIPGLTTVTRDIPATVSRPVPESTPQGLSHKMPAALQDQQGLQATIQRDVNCLTDQDRNLRRNAITQLDRKLFSAANPHDAPQLQQVVTGNVLIPMVRLLADPVEKCREGALSFLTSAAERLPEPAALLSALMPAITDRMGDVPVIEPTEEQRLAIIKLIAGPVILRSGHDLSPYLHIVVKVVCRALEDSFHDIKKAGCSAIANLCQQIPADALRAEHEALLASLIPNLSHQHSRVRVSTLAALDTLVNKGVSEQNMVQVIAPAIKPLVSDRASAVKEACFASVASWLGASRQASSQAQELQLSAVQYRAFLVELLPVVLLGLTDEASSIRDATMLRLEQIGQQHAALQSKEDRLKSNDLASSSSSQQAWTYAFTQPFQAEPAVDIQHMVQDILPSILPAVVAELREWTVSLRLNAARCLQSVLLLAQSATSAHLPYLLHPLCSAAGDEDQQVAQYVVQAAQVVGAFVNLSHWLPLMVDSIAAPQASFATRVNTLVVLAAMLHAAGVVQQPVQDQELQALVAALCSDTVRNLDQGPAQQQLLAVIYNTILLAGHQCTLVGEQLWLLLLQLQAAEAFAGLAQQAAATSERLAVACGQASAADLAAVHAPTLINTLTQTTDAWTAKTPDFQVFTVLLLNCPGTTLAALFPQALHTLCSIVPDTERDPVLRTSVLQLIDQLLANKDTAKAFSGNAAQQLANEAILPALVWRAGKTAAAVRFAAITALSTLFAEQLITSDQLQVMLAGDKLLPMLFHSLEEEYFVDTRLSACSAMYHLLVPAGKLLSPEQRRLMYPELLKRLDDSSNAVRTSICAALQIFIASMETPLEAANMTYLFNGVVIHMDDIDPVIQEAVCQVLETAAVIDPTTVHEVVAKVQHLHRSATYITRVLTACKE